MTSVVDRRRFLLTSLAGVLAAPLAAGAQLAKDRVALVIIVDKARYTKLPFAHAPPR